MLKSFKPVVNENTVQIIVGTMPGEASLKAGQYYAYKHNNLWRIVFDVFDGVGISCDYSCKLNVLLKNRTGLWDALAYCKRKGSLDKNIMQEKPNDFKSLLKKYPKIKKLLFNGQKANKYFVKYFGYLEGIEYIVLPSTSPANASKKYKDKLALWSKALDLKK
ncbi:MAG: DNA-deoxyinosine glycosylase [Endomicrobiaceae bacterium]